MARTTKVPHLYARVSHACIFLSVHFIPLSSRLSFYIVRIRQTTIFLSRLPFILTHVFLSVSFCFSISCYRLSILSSSSSPLLISGNNQWQAMHRFAYLSDTGYFQISCSRRQPRTPAVACDLVTSSPGDPGRSDIDVDSDEKRLSKKP